MEPESSRLRHSSNVIAVAQKNYRYADSNQRDLWSDSIRDTFTACAYRVNNSGVTFRRAVQSSPIAAVSSLNNSKHSGCETALGTPHARL